MITKAKLMRRMRKVLWSDLDKMDKVEKGSEEWNGLYEQYKSDYMLYQKISVIDDDDKAIDWAKLVADIVGGVAKVGALFFMNVLWAGFEKDGTLCNNTSKTMQSLFTRAVEK